MQLSVEDANTLSCSWDNPETEKFAHFFQFEWEDCGKFQYQTTILRHKETGKFYRMIQQRSGSYFSEYNYEWEHHKYGEDFLTLQEVKMVQRTVIDWIVVDKT